MSIICHSVHQVPQMHSAVGGSFLHHFSHNWMTLYVVPSSSKRAVLTCRWTATWHCTHQRTLQRRQHVRLMQRLKHPQTSHSMRDPPPAMTASAEQDKIAVVLAPQADMGDTELQRRNAALLQRVRPLQLCQHVCTGTCPTTVAGHICLRTSILCALPAYLGCVSRCTLTEKAAYAYMRPCVQVVEALAQSASSASKCH